MPPDTLILCDVAGRIIFRLGDPCINYTVGN
jgi:hypothetical protein